MSNAHAPTYPSPMMTNKEESFYYPGLTKREEFAKAAMQGLSGNAALASTLSPIDIARKATLIADRTLEQLEKTNV